MYSVLLMASLTAGADVPQELFPHRPHLFGARSTGCAGSTYAAPPREVYHAPAPVRGWFASHLHARGVFVAHAPAAPRSSYGCAGATISVAAVPRATGCSGGTMTLVGPQVAVAGVAQPAAQAVGAGFLQRVAVHRQLRVALRSDRLTPEQAAVARRALDDPDLYEAAVTKVHRDLAKSLQAKAAAQPGSVGAIGDGHLLQLLLDNLPKIIEAIKQIMALFGFVSPRGDGWRAMPVGPYPLPRAVAPPIAWNAC